ncbi:DNA glycosylase [Choanephora cucurbitarum]|nr:DNA glycosylase [Choanephora cucurbitarum]
MHMDNAIDHFKKHDPKLAAYLNQTTIDLFKTKLTKSEGTNPFQSLARSIFYQQIHGKAATAIYNRFLQLFGEHEPGWFPTPEQFSEKKDDELRSVGLSTRKIEYLRDLASKFKEKQITPEKFDTMSSEEISQQLCAVKGIGQWTVDMFLIFHLRHPDILPLGDLAVRKGVANHFGLALPSDKKKIFPPPQHMTELTELWRPYRTLGSWLMWHISDTQVTGDE